MCRSNRGIGRIGIGIRVREFVIERAGSID